MVLLLLVSLYIFAKKYSNLLITMKREYPAFPTTLYGTEPWVQEIYFNHTGTSGKRAYNVFLNGRYT